MRKNQFEYELSQCTKGIAGVRGTVSYLLEKVHELERWKRECKRKTANEIALEEAVGRIMNLPDSNRKDKQALKMALSSYFDL